MGSARRDRPPRLGAVARGLDSRRPCAASFLSPRSRWGSPAAAAAASRHPSRRPSSGRCSRAVSGSAAGKALFASNGCGACHTYKPAASTGKVGPDLDKLAADAQKAHRGALDAYVKESIEDPDAYVVPGFSKGVMPPFQGKLTDSQIDDLVKFLTNP